MKLLCTEQTYLIFKFRIKSKLYFPILIVVFLAGGIQ